MGWVSGSGGFLHAMHIRTGSMSQVPTADVSMAQDRNLSVPSPQLPPHARCSRRGQAGAAAPGGGGYETPLGQHAGNGEHREVLSKGQPRCPPSPGQRSARTECVAAVLSYVLQTTATNDAGIAKAGVFNDRIRRRRYCNTAISDTLREAHPRSTRAIVCSNMEDCLPAYQHLVEGAVPCCVGSC